MSINITQLISYETPRFYINFMAIFGIFGGIVNLSTLYVIIVATPTNMKGYKPHLMWHQVLSIIFELLLHTAIPEVFFPAISCKMHGPLWTIVGLPFKRFFEISVICQIILIMSTIQCVIYRHRQVLPAKHWLKFRKSTWVFIGLLHYILWPLFAFYCVEIMSTNLSPTNAQIIVDTLPEYSFLKNDSNIWIIIPKPLAPPIINSTSEYGIIVIILVLAPEISILASSLTWHSFYLLEARSTKMSERTKMLQRKFLVALIMQILIPFLTIAFPWLLYATVVGLKLIIPQYILNFALLVNSTHAMTSSIFIWGFTEPYRKFLTHSWKRFRNVIPSSRSVSVVQI